MRCIILSGGYGNRLSPLTKVLSKQLLPVYDKPMIYYSLSMMIKFKIKEFLIISNPEYINLYKKLLGNGKSLGIKIKFCVQNKPKGIADSIKIGKKFIGNKDFILLLGDNLLYGDDLINKFELAKINLTKNYSSIFGLEVKNPNEYGVLKMKGKKILKIVEKPKKLIGKFAIPGVYFYKNDIVKLVNKIKPSNRDELEITDLNNLCIFKNSMRVLFLDPTTIWMDMGSPIRLLEASSFVSSIENRNNLKFGCIEESSYKSNFIDLKKLKDLIYALPVSNYRDYLVNKYGD